MIGKILNSRYHIISQLGQGSFGATFIAEDRWQNQKHCVIKQLKPDVLSPATQYLFEKEAEILFKLGSHNQIPQLLAHFQEDGVFYIVQEFIEGNDLNQEIKRGEKLGEKQVIKLLIEILEVLEYLHQNQVIHRDIKPVNIIRCRDGKIVLIDFGGIKQVRARSADSTVLTAIVGTPGYMPMEQFNNNAQFCSDIYAVGMMGIFALTGIVPGSFSSSPEGEILWRDKAQVSEQLADIIDKMVKFDYRQRYQSATEVLAVLKWFLLPKHWRCVSTLEGYPIFAYEGIAISPDKQILASSIRGKKIKLWQLSTGKEIRTLSSHSKLIICISISRDGKLLVSGSLDKTIKLWEMNTGKEIYTLSGDSLVISSVAFSPDSQILIGGSFDNTIRIWQVSTGREIRNLTGHSSGVFSVAISPDGQLIASASADKTIKLWQVNTGREISTLNCHSGSVRTVAFSPDGQTLAGGSYDTTITLWEVSTGREISTFNGHSATVRAVAFSPDGQILASASYDGTIKIWQVSTGREVCTLTGHSDRVNSIVFSPDGQILASGSSDTTIKIWQRE